MAIFSVPCSRVWRRKIIRWIPPRKESLHFVSLADSSRKKFQPMQVALKEDMKGGTQAGRTRRLQADGREVCMVCGKRFTADEEKDGQKLFFTEDETNLFVDEAGIFSCGKHRRDQVCHDCFEDVLIKGHLAYANRLRNLEFRQDMQHAVKRMWKKIYLKEGEKIPWSDDDDEDDKEEVEVRAEKVEVRAEKVEVRAEKVEVRAEKVEVRAEKVQKSKEKASSSSLSGNKKCAHCGKVENLSRCAKCKVTLYCSRSHQAADYAKHKAHCQAPKTPGSDTAQPTLNAPRSDTVQPAPKTPWNDRAQPTPKAPRSDTVQPAPKTPWNDRARPTPKVPRSDTVQPAPKTPWNDRARPTPKVPRSDTVQPAPKTPWNDRARPTPKVPRSDTAQPAPKTPGNDTAQPIPKFSSAKACGRCGKTNNLSMCSRCKMKYYCSKDHQKADHGTHKFECELLAARAELHVERPDLKSIPMHKHVAPVPPAAMATVSVISWTALEKMHPSIAIGRALEVTVVSEPTPLIAASCTCTCTCDGRDAEGVVRRITLFTHRLPQGFKTGCVLRWCNPWFQYFSDGASGANIEYRDLPNVTFS